MSIQTTSSLGLDLTVTQGRNQILTPVGRYKALYQQTLRGADVVTLDLAPQAIYNSNTLDTISQLVVNTSGPLVLTTMNPAATLTINSLCVLDGGCDSFTLTNPDTANTVTIQVCTLVSMVTQSVQAYFGNASDPGGYTAAFIQTLAQSPTTKGAFTFNAPLATDYLWYASATQATFSVNGFEGGFAVVATVPIAGVNYYLYRSDWPGLGTITVTIT